MTLSPRVKAAIELMIFGGDDGRPLTRQDAARTVGLADGSLRLAFRNPEVMAHYNAQLDVLRSSARPRAFSQIVDLSEKATAEGVRLKAAQYVDSLGKSEQAGALNIQVNVQQPGYMIAVDPRYAADVQAQPQPARLTTDTPKPLK